MSSMRNEQLHPWTAAVSTAVDALLLFPRYHVGIRDRSCTMAVDRLDTRKKGRCKDTKCPVLELHSLLPEAWTALPLASIWVAPLPVEPCPWPWTQVRLVWTLSFPCQGRRSIQG